MTERPWTAREAADYLQRDPETVRRWARFGKLPGKKDLADEWRFDPPDVRAAAGGGPSPKPATSELSDDIQAHVAAARARLRRRRS